MTPDTFLAAVAVLTLVGVAWSLLRRCREPEPPGCDPDEFFVALMAILEAEKGAGTSAPPASDPFAVPCDCGPPTPVPLAPLPSLPLAYIDEQVGPFVIRRPVCLAPTCFAPPRPGSTWCLIHGLDRPHDPEHVALSNLAAPNN